MPMSTQIRTPALAAAAVLATASGTVADGPFLLLPTVETLPVPMTATHLASGDLDRDGDPDLVITGRNEYGLAAILWNDGEGGFGVSTTVETGGQTDWVEIADLDGDGILDLVFAVRSFRGRLAVLFGRGDGTFQEAEEIRLGRESRCVLVRDLDGDGDPDLAGLDHREPVISVLANDGNGVFTARFDVVVGGASIGIPYPQSMQSADLDGDGDEDLLVVCTGSSRVSMLRNRGDATFDPPEAWRPTRVAGETGGMSAIAVGDLDLDGAMDAVVPLILIDSPSHVGVFGNLDDPQAVRFRRDVAAPTVSAGGYAFAIALGDLDGDGDPDVIAGHAIPGPITALDNRTVPVSAGGDGTIVLEAPQTIGNDNFVRCVRTVDLDGDCDVDVLALDLVSNAVWVFDNLTPQVNGCGDGAGLRRPSTAVRPSAAGRPMDAPVDAPVVADIDGDGLVTGADVALWLARVGSTPGSDPAPEVTP